jgi:hypothetical protein
LIVLGGPRPPLAQILGELRAKTVAVITAGWQEREDEQGLADVGQGIKAVQLTLHARADEVFARDTVLAAAYKARQIKLKSMQDAYRVRLDHAAQAAKTIGVASASRELRAEEAAASLDHIRHIDAEHLARCLAVHAEFDAAQKPLERPAIAKNVRELRAAIEPCDALVIAGGHVAVLLNRLAMFDVLGLVGKRSIVAWSAGAMTLAERIVLFHDDPPHGQAISEILDAGLARVRGLVILPDARDRLRLDDRERVGELAGRYTPASCITLDPGAQLWIDGDRIVRTVEAQRLDPDGSVQVGWRQ